MTTAVLEPGLYIIKVHATEHIVARNIAEDLSLLPKPVYALSENGKPGGKVSTGYPEDSLSTYSC